MCISIGHQGEGCDRVWCEAPRCHVSQQVLLPGQCCPLCVEPGQLHYVLSDISFLPRVLVNVKESI